MSGGGPRHAERDATTAFARAVVDEWARGGVHHVAVAPGSRSAPIALALAADDRITVHVHLDERSAAFFALGIAKASNRPAVVVCTSGTATANLHPAVLEAHHAGVPLIVCTADRPPELRDTGAGQTIDQRGLYGSILRWECDPGPPEDRAGVGDAWRAMAARSVAEASGPPAGPVHLNLPFREPLVPTGAPLVSAPGREKGEPWTAVTAPIRRADDETVARFATAVQASAHGVLLAGWGADVTPGTAHRFASAAGWPVLADPISGLRTGDFAVSTYDALLRGNAFATAHRPTMAVRIGAPLTNKSVASWLATVEHQIVDHWIVDPDQSWLDPAHAASQLVAVDAESLLAAAADLLGAEPGTPHDDDAWLGTWLAVDRRARAALDALLDGSEEPFEGRIARDVVAAAPAGATVVVASSMPVRDVESFAAPREGIRVLANRGVNGIDGFTSTALGIAAVADDPVVALVGDLCFVHDTNGLLGATERGVDAVFVVIDNDGGGIFSFLPQAEHPEHFETLFGTPHGIDLAALAAVHHIPVAEVEKASALVPAVTEAIRAGGVRVVLVRTDRAENVLRHREVWAAVAEAVA
jgi:2-succinyl-5-enolpyruvyl-6-hydroxy-3-cyclohexene-1-carboxylate synthase